MQAATPTPDPFVFILDLSVNPALYRPTEHWRALLGGVPFRQAALVAGNGGPAAAGASLPGVDAFTHLIVTGSEASIVEPRPWFAPAEVQPLVDAALGAPARDDGFGHALVAQFLGAGQ